MKNIVLIIVGALLVCYSCVPKNSPKGVSETGKADMDCYKVGFLIMDGVYNTELTAPYDIFHHTKFRKGIRPMCVFTIARSLEDVETFEGLRIRPDYAYSSDFPEIDILVVPSAEHHLDTDLEDEQMLTFVKETAKNAAFVTSHCDGAFVLAKAGLLDSAVSTTFPSDVETMRQMFPSLDVRDSLLFVHDGKFITSAGGAKSFEAALYLVEHLYGKEVAESIARGLVIDWNQTTLKFLKIEPDP